MQYSVAGRMANTGAMKIIASYLHSRGIGHTFTVGELESEVYKVTGKARTEVDRRLRDLRKYGWNYAVHAAGQENNVPVTTVVHGTNAELIHDVASLYLTPGQVIADVTYSTGRFWKKTDLTPYRLLASDLEPATQHLTVLADFRALPYSDGSVDTVVFDPPYIHAPGKGFMADRYNGKKTTDLASYADIMKLYESGMIEAARVLTGTGSLWVKCKDTLASDKQRWSHISVYEAARDLGFYARDLFILVPPSPTAANSTRWARQLHARKTHSYLWIFEAGGYRKRG